MGSPHLPQAVAPRAKRKLSAAGRKAISEATKKRWALKRAEAAKTSAPIKKTPPKKTSNRKTRRTSGTAAASTA